jgi:magnesium chelatase subunit H
MLDDLFETLGEGKKVPVKALEADSEKGSEEGDRESPEENFVRKHVLEMEGKGLDRPTSRLFSNPAGDFGSMVNERVGTADWDDDGTSLGETWAQRNAFSYGGGQERGKSRPEVLQELLTSTERVVQQIDSVE